MLNKETIIELLSGKFTGSDSHRKMLPPERELSMPSNTGKVKNSSVMLLLYPEKNELFACLIKRPAHMKHHAGQIALPGGKIEESETALQSALRETYEEIGIPPEKITVLGQLSELYVSVSGFLIYPFVGWANEKPDFKLNKNEVGKILLFPLLKHRNIVEKFNIETSTGWLTVPGIPFEDEIIWGATAMIITEFYDLIDKHLPNHQQP